MIASNLQVHKDALALMKLIIHYLNTSPRTLRYSLGGIIIKSMARCISEIRIANSNEGARRIEHINLAFGELEDARTFCRVFTESIQDKNGLCSHRMQKILPVRRSSSRTPSYCVKETQTSSQQNL